MNIKIKKDNKGSFTVEAAFVVPIFFFSMLALLFLFKVMLMQMQLQTGMTEAAKELSQLAYINSCKEEVKAEGTTNALLLEGKRLAKSFVLEAEVSRYFSSEKEYGNILKSEISYIDSFSLDEEQCIDLVARYTVTIPVPLFHIVEFPMMQRVKIRAFTGTDQLIKSEHEEIENNEEDARYVYVTETGTVYHVLLECSSLNLKISECSLAELKNRRNSSGSKYKACEKCCKKVGNIALVYIGEDGDAYHINKECSGLKRTIHRVLLRDVQDKMRGCRKCSK